MQKTPFPAQRIDAGFWNQLAFLHLRGPGFGFKEHSGASVILRDSGPVRTSAVHHFPNILLLPQSASRACSIYASPCIPEAINGKKSG